MPGTCIPTSPRRSSGTRIFGSRTSSASAWSPRCCSPTASRSSSTRSTTIPAPPPPSSRRPAGRPTTAGWSTSAREAPERRRGQMQTSFDDVDQAVKDVHWAKEHGLGGIMLPELTSREPGRSSTPSSTRSGPRAWRPACRSARTAAPASPTTGPAGFAAMLAVMAENAFFSNRSLWMLISGGVFDRFPELRVSYVETQAYLLVAALQHLDSMVNPAGDWMGFARTMDREETTERFASEYLGTERVRRDLPVLARPDPDRRPRRQGRRRAAAARRPHRCRRGHVRRGLPAVRVDLRAHHGRGRDPGGDSRRDRRGRPQDPVGERGQGLRLRSRRAAAPHRPRRLRARRRARRRREADAHDATRHQGSADAELVGEGDGVASRGQLRESTGEEDQMAKTAIISIDGHVKGSRQRVPRLCPAEVPGCLRRTGEGGRGGRDARCGEPASRVRPRGPVGLRPSDREPREHRRGGRGAVRQRPAVPDESAR